jgi:hypothetical protein
MIFRDFQFSDPADNLSFAHAALALHQSVSILYDFHLICEENQNLLNQVNPQIIEESLDWRWNQLFEFDFRVREFLQISQNELYELTVRRKGFDFLLKQIEKETLEIFERQRIEGDYHLDLQGTVKKKMAENWPSI